MLAEEYVLTHKRVPECWVNNQGENSNFTLGIGSLILEILTLYDHFLPLIPAILLWVRQRLHVFIVRR